jgi:peptidoglycan/LPS O-acetylase OafA/YrhL
VILWAIENPGSVVGRILNSRPFVHVGVMSYSVYLWQQLWLSHGVPTPLWMAPVFVLAAFLCAEASYRFVETPMLRLRQRLTFRSWVSQPA